MKKRRRFTPEFKARVVLDVLTGVHSPAEACRKHSLGPNLRPLWKAAFLEKAHLVFDADSARSAEQARIAELKQVQGLRPLSLPAFPLVLLTDVDYGFRPADHCLEF